MARTSRLSRISSQVRGSLGIPASDAVVETPVVEKAPAPPNYLQTRGFETDPKTGLPVNVDRDAAFKNIREELQNQYDNLVAYDPKLAYRGRSSDLPRIFDQQANQLADAGVVTVTSLRNVNGKLVDIYQVDGMKDKVINTTNLKGQIATDRDTGAVKWGDIFSGVKGGANYGISFDDKGSPIFYPVYEKSKSPIAQIGLGGLESVIAPILTIGGALVGVPGLGAIGGAAAGAAAGNTTGQLLASGKVDWEQVAKSAAVAGAGAGIGEAIGGAEAAGGTDYSLTAGGADVGGLGFQVPAGEVAGLQLAPDVVSEGLKLSAAQLAPEIGANLLNVGAGLGAVDYSLLGGTTPAQLGTIGETGLLPGAAGEGLQLPTVPALPSMGGGQGLVLPVDGGFVGETGFTPIGATPVLGDPGSFINDPNVLGQPVVSGDYLNVGAGAGLNVGLSDALLGAGLLAGGQQQLMGMPGQQAPFQPAGVDYSGIYGLLGQRPSVPGIQSLLGPAQIRYPSLLG